MFGLCKLVQLFSVRTQDYPSNRSTVGQGESRTLHHDVRYGSLGSDMGGWDLEEDHMVLEIDWDGPSARQAS